MAKVKHPYAELSPTDRVAFYQGRFIERQTKAFKAVALRLVATLFASSARRYQELVDEARKLAVKEFNRPEYRRPKSVRRKKHGK